MLFDKISKELQNFLHIKDKTENDKIKLSLLRVLIGEITKKDKSPSDDHIIIIIKKMIFDNKSIINILTNDSTKITDIDKLNIENDLLNEYLPIQLSENEIVQILYNLKTEKNIYSVGDINKYFKLNYSGQYDGKILNSIINKK